MTWSLVRKELWQHWLAFLLAGMLTVGGGSVVIAASLVRGQAGTPFEGYRLFVAIFGVILALVVCHRLVVLEYQARTQLFLEGLPFSRWRMLAVKYGLGLIFIFVVMVVGFAASLVLAARHDPASPGFMAIAAVRAGTYAWCAYNFFFMMGLLGRYRAAIYIGLALVLLGLQEMSALQFARFGPFALVDSTFAYEADQFPWAALRDTWYLAGAFLGTGVLLGLTREGSVAALLAERMSHREKVFISALLVGLLWTVTLVSEKAKRVAFDLPEAVTETAPGVVVKVAASPGDQPGRIAAENLARTVKSELGALREYLGTGEIPPVFITSRHDLDPDRYERGELENHHGLHAQANFLSPQWQVEDFMPWLIREVLIIASNDRAKHESRRFVLDGFALYWTRHGARDHRDLPLPLLKLRKEEGESSQGSSVLQAADSSVIQLRALYGTRDGFNLQQFSRWLSFREQVGDPIASAVACSALECLNSSCNPEQFRAFVRATLAPGTPRDLRAVLGAGGEDWQRALELRAKVSASRFFANWQNELVTARKEHGDRVEMLPRVQVDLHPTRVSDLSREIVYSVRVTPVPADTAVVSFLYQILPPYDEEVDEQEVQREQSTYSAARDRRIPGGYSRHQRLLYTAAYHSPELHCEVISGWKRMEVR